MATRDQIRDRARIRADQDKSQFPTDAQYDLIVDACSRTIFNDLVAAGWPVKRTVETVTLTGATSYPINFGDPVNSVTHVYLLQGGQAIELKRVNEADVAGSRSSLATGVYPEYEVSVDMSAGPVVQFFPSNATGTVKVEYVPEWTGFIGGSSVWYGPSHSDELIVLMAAAAGARKEGETSDARALDDEYRALWERVIAHASRFDGRGLPRIRDVETRTYVSDPFDYEV